MGSVQEREAIKGQSSGLHVHHVNESRPERVPTNSCIHADCERSCSIYDNYCWKHLQKDEVKGIWDE